MKLTTLATALLFSLIFTGCATTTTSQKEINKKVDKVLSSAWYQRTMRR